LKSRLPGADRGEEQLAQSAHWQIHSRVRRLSAGSFAFRPVIFDVHLGRFRRVMRRVVQVSLSCVRVMRR
jgi:hypothetical protein